MMNLPDIGDVVDETYEIQSVLGTGGFGAVYLARQINMDRDVALKLLVASGPKFGEMVKRFRREVMSIRNLTHPNTIRVYDFKDNPDGLLYYTMEALKGLTLKEEVRNNGPVSPRRLKHILRQVMKSLSEAHSHGIVHRDLKPANIMLVDMHGETDFVKVLDFGIAKTMAGEDEEDLTSAGILVGTLRYMAPEQIIGGHMGPQIDLYAAGLIAMEILTGESVFAGTGQMSVLQAQISQDAVPIPEAVLACGMGPIIEKCLKKDLAQRFKTSDEILAALAALNDNALSADPIYMSDGKGGWVPAAGGGMPTVKVEALGFEESDARTEMVSLTPEFEGEKTQATPSPFYNGGASTIPMSSIGAAPVSPATKSPATPPSAAVPAPASMSTSKPGRKATTDFGLNPSIADKTGEVVKPGASEAQGEGVNKTLLYTVVALLVLLTVVGAGLFLTRDKGEEPETTGGELLAAAEEPRAEQAQEPGAEVAYANEVDEGVAGEAGEDRHELVVDTPGARARLFVGDELLGRTPHTLVLAGDEELLVRAEATGYESQEVRVSREVGASLAIELEPVRQAAAEPTAPPREERPPSTTPPRQETNPTPRPPREEPQPTTRPPAGSDWLDIPSTPAAETEEEAVEIPLF